MCKYNLKQFISNKMLEGKKQKYQTQANISYTSFMM